MLFRKYLQENTDEFYDIQDDEMEQDILTFVMSLPEESLTDEQEADRDKIVDMCLKIFEELEIDRLNGENVAIYASLTDEIAPGEDNEEFEFDTTNEELSEKILLNRMSRAAKRKAKKYRRVNKVKMRKNLAVGKRKNKAKLRRASKTGIGLTGKRRGLHKRRKAL